MLLINNIVYSKHPNRAYNYPKKIGWIYVAFRLQSNDISEKFDSRRRYKHLPPPPPTLKKKSRPRGHAVFLGLGGHER